MAGKLISVIVTIYNREDFLEECLDSLKRQTYPNFEAIMVDDGSTDGSLTIAQRYANEDQRFKLIASEHVGFPEAKNIGLRNVQGEYIIFLDSDDIAYPDWLKILYDLCEVTEADISTCLYDEFIDGKKERAKEPEEEWLNKASVPIQEYDFLKMNLLFQYNCTSYMWNKLVKKELYKDIRFVDQIAMSDISTMYKIFDKANKIVQVHLPLIHYRRHTNSMGNNAHKQLGTLDYYILRTKIIAEVYSFVLKKYPQSKRAVQIVLQRELNLIKEQINKVDFYNYIYTDFFKEILNSKSLIYVNKI